MAGYDYDGRSEVVVLCPTRENAAGALEMCASFYETVSRVSTEVVLVVDADDPQLQDYLAIPDRLRDLKVGMGVRRPDPPRVMIVEGGTLTKATNEAVARMWDVDCIIGHVGDDHRFRTNGWDTVIRNTLKDRPGVAYAFDGFRSAWASAWWTNMIIVRTLGWLAVPGSMHLTIDDIFMDIGAGLGRLTFLPELLIEHLHPAGGKVEWRPIVRSHYRKDRRDREEKNMQNYRNEHFADDIHRLQDALGMERTEVTDLAPGKTFRQNLRLGRRFATIDTVKVWPTEEELAEFAGRVLRPNTQQWLRARLAWERARA